MKTLHHGGDRKGTISFFDTRGGKGVSAKPGWLSKTFMCSHPWSALRTNSQSLGPTANPTYYTAQQLHPTPPITTTHLCTEIRLQLVSPPSGTRGSNPRMAANDFKIPSHEGGDSLFLDVCAREGQNVRWRGRTAVTYEPQPYDKATISPLQCF